VGRASGGSGGAFAHRLLFRIHISGTYGKNSFLHFTVNTIAARCGGAQTQFFQNCNSPRQLLRFTATPFRRIEGDKSVSENDAIFATSISLKLGLQKWHRFPNFQFL
jgi:hypothetical protein